MNNQRERFGKIVFLTASALLAPFVIAVFGTQLIYWLSKPSGLFVGIFLPLVGVGIGSVLVYFLRVEISDFHYFAKVGPQRGVSKLLMRIVAEILDLSEYILFPLYWIISFPIARILTWLVACWNSHCFS